jgi:adenine C2-methylase RlmN of 23S rRNA A2503 and tRNA A37
MSSDNKDSKKYWNVKIDKGDLIHVHKSNGDTAVLCVSGVVGNQVLYQVVESDDHYYGTDLDNHKINKQVVVQQDNFKIEHTEGHNYV